MHSSTSKICTDFKSFNKSSVTETNMFVFLGPNTRFLTQSKSE